MSEPASNPNNPPATSQAQIPVELYMGPMCGQPMMVDPAAPWVELTCAATQEVVIYEPSELTCRKGCKVFRFAHAEPMKPTV